MPSRTPNPNRIRGIRQRKEQAGIYFRRGWTNAEVARSLGVTPETVKRYKDEYDEQIRNEAATNPGLMRDVIKNAVEALRAIDDLRAEAWNSAMAEGVLPAVKATFLGIALKAERQRADILGLLGVKSDTTALYARIKSQQERLIDFMSNHLCEDDRRMLESFLVESFASDLEDITDLAGLAST